MCEVQGVKRAGVGLIQWVLVAALLGCGAKSKPPPLVSPQLETGRRQLRYTHGVKMFSTSNGLLVAVVPERNTNLVRVDVRYRVGAAEDPRGKAGLAHLVEHMLFTVRKKAGDPTLGDRLTRSALSWNAYTNWDETHYTATALQAKLPELLAIEKERMAGTCEQLDANAFARERQVVEQELLQRGVGTGDALEPLRAALFGKEHAYARSVGGTVKQVMALQMADVCTFIKDYYAPSRAILVVSGAVRFADVRRVVGPLFGPIPKRAVQKRHRIGRFRLRATSRIDMDIEEAALVVAFPEPPWGRTDAMATRLLIDRMAIGLYEEKQKRDFITGVAATRIGGYRGGSVVFVISVATPAALARAEKSFAAAYKSAFKKKADVDTHRELVGRQQAALLRGVEPFQLRATTISDYMQYTKHNWLMLADLRTLDGISEPSVRALGAQRFAPSSAHVVKVHPIGKGKGKAATRQLEVTQKTKQYDIEMWREPVNAADAAKALPLPPRRNWYHYEELTLDNGLRVVIVPNLSYPLIDIRMVYPVGRAHEPAGKRGLATWAAELLELNYGVRVSARDHGAIKFVLGTGGDMTNEVGEVSTSFHIRGLSMYADAHLWRLHFLLHQGVYSKKELTLRRIVTTKRESDPERRQTQRLLGRLNQSLYGSDHPYTRAANTNTGTITLSDLRRFRAQNYRARGATLIVAGNFDPDKMRARVRRLFGSFANKGATASASPVPVARPAGGTKHIGLINKGGAQTRVLIAFPTNRGFLGRRAGRRILKEMIDLRMARVRQRLGVSYGVNVSYITRRGPGMLMVSSNLASAQAGAALSSMLEALAELRSGKSLAEDFVRARRKVLEQSLAATVDSDTVGGELEFLTTHGLSFSNGRKLARDIAQMTLAKLAKLIRSEMAEQRMLVLLSGSRSSVRNAFATAGIKGHRELTR